MKTPNVNLGPPQICTHMCTHTYANMHTSLCAYYTQAHTLFTNDLMALHSNQKTDADQLVS